MIEWQAQLRRHHSTSGGKTCKCEKKDAYSHDSGSEIQGLLHFLGSSMGNGGYESTSCVANVEFPAPVIAARFAVSGELAGAGTVVGGIEHGV